MLGVCLDVKTQRYLDWGEGGSILIGEVTKRLSEREYNSTHKNLDSFFVYFYRYRSSVEDTTYLEDHEPLCSHKENYWNHWHHIWQVNKICCSLIVWKLFFLRKMVWYTGWHCCFIFVNRWSFLLLLLIG